MELKDMLLGASAVGAAGTAVVSGVYYGRDYLFYGESYDIASGKFKVEADARAASRIVVFESLDEAKSCKDKILKYVDSTAHAAQVGDYVSIRITDNQYVHIRNAELTDVRKEILDDTQEYPYEISFKNAEYHAYVTIKNVKTEAKMHVGVSVNPIAAWHGNKFIRNEDSYNQKYSRGHDNSALEEGKNHKRDKGSSKVKFKATDKELYLLFEKVSHDDEEFGGLSNNGRYKFMKWLDSDGNCIDYAHEIYQYIGLPAHYYSFLNSNELDFQDQGVAYGFWLRQKYDASAALHVSSTGVMANLIGVMYVGCTFIGPIVDTALHHIGYKSEPSISQIQELLDGCEEKIKEINVQDQRGDTPLHIALKIQNIDAATKILDYGADVNIQNGRGDTALHLAAGLPKSQAKLDLLKVIIEKAKDINVEDKYSDDIPLTKAAKANDPEAMELLISHGANLQFVNNNKDHIINVLAESMRVDDSDANFMATDYIWEHDRDQFYYDNGNRHYAVHHPNFHGRYEGREGDHPEKKTDEELYCYYTNFSEKFAELRSGADEMHKEPQDY